MIWLVQILAIQFAISMAKHDGPAVSNFEYYGAGDKDMAVFHRYGWWSKFFFCAAMTIVPAQWPNTDLLDMFFRGLLSFLWIYLLFDPALNRSRKPRKDFFYLGLNDADGRFWNGTFGRNGGKVKFIVLLAIIAGVNVLIQVL